MKQKLSDLVFLFLSLIWFGKLNKDYAKHLRIRSLAYRKRKLRLAKHDVAELSVENTDTVFILGSGETLAELTDEQWAIISQHYVVGVNMSVLHDYPVDMQFWEPIESEVLNRLFLDRVKEDKFKNTKIVISELYAMRNNIRAYLTQDDNQVFEQSFGYYPIELTMTQPSVSALSKLVKRFKKDTDILHHCTQIGAAVDYCYNLGFRKVVLVGCDLNGGKYFSEVESASSNYPNQDSYELFNSERINMTKKLKTFYGDEHPTMKKEHTEVRGRLTAIDYFEVMSRYYAEKNCQLMVSSDKSTLSNYLPVYDLNHER